MLERVRGKTAKRKTQTIRRTRRITIIRIRIRIIIIYIREKRQTRIIVFEFLCAKTPNDIVNKMKPFVTFASKMTGN